MLSLSAAIEIAKENLNSLLAEEYSKMTVNGGKPLPVNFSEELDDCSHMVIFATLEKIPRSNKTHILSYFSGNPVLEVKDQVVMPPRFLKDALPRKENFEKCGRINHLARKVFATTEDFCKDYNLKLISVPFMIVFEKEIIITEFPKFEHLCFKDPNNSKNYLDLNPFFEKQAKALMDIAESDFFKSK